MPRKPVLGVTLHRRYTELARNLAASRRLFGEFPEPPAVVVVAAQPEAAALPFLARLVREGLAHHVLYRPSEGLDGEAATPPESQNIDLFLRFARDVWGPDAYAVLQAADVRPEPQTYALVDAHMQDGGAGVVFHWANGTTRHNIWHTNFFAVALGDASLWPSVSPPNDPDVLERQWGRKLSARGYPGRWWQTHNSRCQRFVHEHLPPAPPPACDEPLPPPPRRPWWRLF
jgi:hypothetical protein